MRSPSQSQRDSAFLAGRTAAKRKLGRRANPYDSPALADGWDSGYNEEDSAK